MKSEARNSGEASRRDQSETKVLNPKLEALNSKQTQNRKNYLLSFLFWICLGFRV